MEGAKAFQQQLVFKGATLLAFMQTVLDRFTAGEGGAVDPPAPEVQRKMLLTRAQCIALESGEVI